MSLLEFFYLAVAFLLSLSVHEAAHAMAAYYLGDNTAKLEGRLTLNPLKHLDVAGTIVFLVTRRIGWAKPVPVNPNNFASPVRDNALVAFAGPLSNFILVLLVALLLKHLRGYMPIYLVDFLWLFWHVNLLLGIFNLFPLPPLDGSKVLGAFVPRAYWPQYFKFLEKGQKYFIAIMLFDVFILGQFFGFSVFRYLMSFFYEELSVFLRLGT